MVKITIIFDKKYSDSYKIVEKEDEIKAIF